LLQVLEQMTDFFKEGHAAEVCRVIDSGEDSFFQAKNLLNIEFPNVLVMQSKLLKEKAEDFAKKTKALLYIQEDDHRNDGLRKQFKTVNELLADTISTFILASKEHLVTMNTAGHTEKKAFQNEQYKAVHACLSELKRICEQIKVRYNNAFDESQSKPVEDDLDDAAADLFDSLANLRLPKMTPKELEDAQKMVPVHTKEVLKVMDNRECPMELQKELIGGVKQARDGSVPEYFDALKCLEQTLQKARNLQPPNLSLAHGTSRITDTGGARDLLETAKKMCTALKGLNVTLDEPLKDGIDIDL